MFYGARAAIFELSKVRLRSLSLLNLHKFGIFFCMAPELEIFELAKDINYLIMFKGKKSFSQTFTNLEYFFMVPELEIFELAKEINFSIMSKGKPLRNSEFFLWRPSRNI
ncbi:hypothetical protein ACFFRR_010914 [Megaselia abdita]